LHVAGIAGHHGDLIPGQHRGSDVGVGDGNPGSVPDGSRGIGLTRIEGNVRDTQPVYG
jgi:hypothetical protein